MSIRVYYDKIKFRINKTGEIKKFLEKVIKCEKKVPGDLKFIFTDDKTELEINRRFLGHDYYTDVISFDYSDGIKINGEIYISIETLKKNALIYNADIKEELVRVMIHGILHLCGYKDNSKRSKELMFGRQEELINEFRRIAE